MKITIPFLFVGSNIINSLSQAETWKIRSKLGTVDLTWQPTSHICCPAHTWAQWVLYMPFARFIQLYTSNPTMQSLKIYTLAREYQNFSGTSYTWSKHRKRKNSNRLGILDQRKIARHDHPKKNKKVHLLQGRHHLEF